MAGKSDLPTEAGVQNVVVYVSNDNFAQAYAVGQQNVPAQPNIQNEGYQNTSHTLASVVGPPKSFEKQIYTSGGQIVNTSQAGFFANVITQNGFPQPVVNNIGYQSGTIIKNYSSNDVVSCERQQAGPGRPEKVRGDECDNRDSFVEPFVTVMGAEVPTQSVRCDSVRSETAESSCSSLSSADEGMVIVQNQSPDMVVYDPSVSVRPGGVVLTVGAPQIQQHQIQDSTSVTPNQQQQQFVMVPPGWKRLVNNGSIIYISPSNAALSSPEQVKEYLLTSGTCKCGLECHFKYDNVFNFDPKVHGKPWVLSPDTNTGDLTKLCNHKRKIIAMASLDCKPPDPNVKMRKDYGIKRKKRKIGLPYAGGVSLSQILAQREKFALNHHNFNKESVVNQQQAWPQNPVNNAHILSNRLQGYPNNLPNHLTRGEPPGSKLVNGPPIVIGENPAMVPQPNVANNISHQALPQNHPVSQNSGPNAHVHSQHIIGPNGQIINVQGSVPPGQSPVVNHMPSHNNGIVIQGQNLMQAQQPHQHRLLINSQPNEPSGPGRPNVQMIPVTPSNQQPRPEFHRMHQQQHHPQQQFYNSPSQYPQVDPSKNVRSFNPVVNGFRPQGINNQNNLVQTSLQPPQQRMPWTNRLPINMNQQQPGQMISQHNMQSNQNMSSVFERVPPLHQHMPAPMWQEEIRRKKVKLGKSAKSRPYPVMDACQSNNAPCPNIDVRQIPNDNGRAVVINQHQQNSQNASSPSFMEDPSGYLAQQTALLNSTINRQTGANPLGYVCSSPVTSIQGPSQNIVAISNISNQASEVPLPSNMMTNIKSQTQIPRHNHNVNISRNQQMPQNQQTTQNHQMIQNQQMPQNQQMSQNQQIPQNIVINQQYNHMHQMQLHQNMQADSSVTNDSQHMYQCQGCLSDQNSHYHNKKYKGQSRPNSQPGTPSSCGTLEDPVTSSLYGDKHSNHSSPDSRPIQGGTVSTSNVSPIDGSPSDAPTPNPHTPTLKNQDSSQINNPGSPYNIQQLPPQNINSRENPRYPNMQKQETYIHQYPASSRISEMPYGSGVVTTMASGRTVGSNTITSVLAGRANTATVSINSPASLPGSSTPTSNVNASMIQTQAALTNVSKSPLEMVQSVVSSIQIPQSQQQNILPSIAQSGPQISSHIIKHSPTALPPGHILVSSGGQLIMASTGNSPGGVMAPPPPKVMANQNTMPPMSVSPMVTNVTAAVTQMIPTVAQQVLGQQTVLVNALPAPFVLQPGVTMTMDGMTVGQNMQLPQLVTGNVIQQQIQIDNSDQRRVPALISPETKKKGKKRKMSSQTVAGMLHIAAQQNPSVVMSQQGFPQQIQMAHSPQGITTGPVMQALTIVPSKTGGPPQIVMNGQAVANTNLGTQQIITNSQPAPQINLLQPVNLINGTTGVVQNFPAIQQFIVPNLGGMVMNPDGTATILQDTTNLGMQLQIQNVNGQNVLTPIQNGNMFNGGQSILAAGPAGMVIRAPTTQGKIIQQQQHSPGAQFLSPNGGQFVVNGAQFSGQLSPLVASVSPSQQVTFNTSPQQIRANNSLQPAQQEFIQMNGQMGQTLMVPCNPQANVPSSSSNQQNTTFVQQNTTIVQHQTTMVSNNQQVQNFQANNQANQQHITRNSNLNLDHHNFIVSSNDSKQMQAVVVHHRESPKNIINCRQSVSTQTAVNQNSQSVTTNTFCQTSTLSAGSPPDTTTLSPMASGGQSPPTADTTTHSGSTDDGLSPAPSNCSASCVDINIQGRSQSCTMAMVHCISSSEPDIADVNSQNSDNDWRKNHPISSTPVPPEYTDITSNQLHYSKKSMQAHVAFAESSTVVSGLQYFNEKNKRQEVVSSRNYEKMIHQRKNSDTMVMLETHHMHSSLFNGDEENEKTETRHTFVVGDLVWGPTKGFHSWPGKILEIDSDKVSIKWFGNDKHTSKIGMGSLQTLSEGLDAHHQARKKCRTSRKLNTQLEKAIQEAMTELDKSSTREEANDSGKPQKVNLKFQAATGKKTVNSKLKSK